MKSADCFVAAYSESDIHVTFLAFFLFYMSHSRLYVTGLHVDDFDKNEQVGRKIGGQNILCAASSAIMKTEFLASFVLPECSAV